MKTNRLPELAPGRMARIVAVETQADWRGRLAALGLVPGEVVEVLRASPHGPCLIAVKDSRLALRREMAETIAVQTI